jgi:serine/threonine protein kinase
VDDAGLVGKVVAGRYRVTRLIGQGAMAAVYEAIQHDEPKVLALKIMHPHLAAAENFVKRFRREAKAASQLDHPNTVRVFDHGVDGSLVYIAMELLTGEQLSAVLARERRFPPARAAEVMAQICDALSAAHDAGIVHRDLKPANIMLVTDATGAERVKVVDFGIAKLTPQAKPARLDATAGSDSNLTTVGSAVGTPEYMSPEQCRGVQVDARSDIYACGVLLYQMVTGRVPFRSEVHVEIMLKHVREPPTPPSALVPGLDPRLEQTILRALSKSPTIRQQSAAELATTLRQLDAMPLPGPTSTPYAPPPPASAPYGPASAPAARAPMGSYGSIAPGPYVQPVSQHEPGPGRLAGIATVVVVFVAIFGLAVVVVVLLG